MASPDTGQDSSFLALDIEEDSQAGTETLPSDLPANYNGHAGKWPRVKTILRGNLTVLFIFVGVVVGLAVGFGLRHLRPSSDLLMWIVTASMEYKASGKIGLVAVTCIVAMNVLGCVTGVICCVIFQPGDGQAATNGTSSKQTTMQAQDIFADLLRNMLPDNMVEATFSKTRTDYKQKAIAEVVNGTSSETDLVAVTKTLVQTRSVNLIGLVVVSALIGMAASKVKSRSTFFVSFFSNASDVVMTLTRGVFWFAPVGLACMTAVSVARVEDISDAFTRLGNFVLSSAIGIVFLQLFVFPLVLFVVTRTNPFPFLLSIARPYLVAFASTSTAVALADMFDACENKNRIDKRVTRVVLPLAVALAKGGSAVYITSAVVFIAQTHYSIDASRLALIGVLVVFGAMALPAVPSSSVVTIVIILTSLNVPTDDVALLFAVEWILDRLRTSCNVICQTGCALVTSRICQMNRSESSLYATVVA